MQRYVAIYLRTSTGRQSKGLESQKLALDNYLEQEQVQNYEVFEAFGISGAKAKRPGLDRLMFEVQGGEISQVVVYSFSRFARSTSHLLRALEEFKRHNTSFISISEKLDTTLQWSQAIFTIISAIAQLERELIAERVKNGLKNAKAKEKKLGRKKDRNSKLIQELAFQGMSYRKIVDLAKCSISLLFTES